MFIRVILLSLSLSLLADNRSSAAAKKPAKPFVKPHFDDSSIPFRMAPMPAASRSIAVSLLPDLHLAFDTERCRIHTVWTGKGLHLLGPQYSFAKRPFISTNDVGVLWTAPPWTPWTSTEPKSGQAAVPATAAYRSVSSKGGGTSFSFDVETRNSGSTGIRLTLLAQDDNRTSATLRSFTVAASESDLWYAAHSDFRGVTSVTDGYRISDALHVHFPPREGMETFVTAIDADYAEQVFTEAGAEKGNPTVRRKGRLSTIWVRVPAGTQARTFSIVTTAGTSLIGGNPSVTRKRSPQAEALTADAGFAFSQASTKSYRAEPFPLPKELELLVTGMDFLPNGDLAVCTWPGDICIIHNPTNRPAAATYTRFARGLCEPMGLVVKDGEIYVGMKNELARVKDTDGDGVADLVERINADWSYTGHYNAFSYGPVVDRHGEFVLANAGHSGRWDAKYTGWAFRVAADGSRLTPICSGLREPNGIGVFGPDRDIFISDNQGSWIGECRLDHIAPGKFHGHPSGWPSKKEDYGKPGKMDPPAVWFPYTLARSTTDIAEIPEGFGPFTGQLVVGDFQNAIVMRVMLEKVDGEYQGAVWPFLKRFASGVNRLVFGPDKRLYVGGCQRTWASIAPKEAALERIAFTGNVPFEVKSVRARPDGFELEFTEPVDPATAGDPKSYDVLQYALLYRQKYGSPQIDHDGKENSATAIDVTGAKVFADNLRVRLTVAGWRTGHVTMVRGLDVRSAAGDKLVNDTFWYTLNRLPKE